MSTIDRRRSCNTLDIPVSRLSPGQRSYTYRGAKVWISLVAILMFKMPQELEVSIGTFVKQLNVTIMTEFS